VPNFRNSGNTNRGANSNIRWTREYQKFKKSDNDHPVSLYERLTKKFWNIQKVRLSSIPLLKNYKSKFERHIEVARLDIEADQIGSLFTIPLILMLPFNLLITLFLSTAISVFAWIIPFFWIY